MNSKKLPILISALALVAVTVVGCGKAKETPAVAEKPAAKPGEMVTTGSGLQYLIEKPGAGAMATPGHTVTMDYTGTFTNGTVFDSSAAHGPITFGLGAGTVIPAWDEGLTGMKVGEKRRLLVPAELGYGEKGNGATIPPNTPLVYEVELLDVKN